MAEPDGSWYGKLEKARPISVSSRLEAPVCVYCNLGFSIVFRIIVVNGHTSFAWVVLEFLA